MLIHEIADLCLQYDKSLGLLRVAWTAGARMDTFRAGSQALAQLCQRLQVRRCLLEMNSLGDISVYDQIWLGMHWLPEVLRLPLERVVLLIDSHRIHNQLAVESLLRLAQPFMRFDVQFFTLTWPALHWLSDGSPRLEALLAEWPGEPDDTAPCLAEEPQLGYGRYQ